MKGQGQYIDIYEAAIKILTPASIISNDFDIIDANHQYSTETQKVNVTAEQKY